MNSIEAEIPMFSFYVMVLTTIFCVIYMTDVYEMNSQITLVDVTSS